MKIVGVVLSVLFVDQAIKFAVLKYMYIGQSIPVIGDWLRITFTENPGVAFGIRFGPEGTMVVLSIIATAVIITYVLKVRDGHAPYVLSLAFIVGGALGNLIDRTFYGIWVYDTGLFTGRVVDFFHVNVWKGVVPHWIPGLGGSYMALFPIWNFADMAIVGGVIGVFVFQQRFHEMLSEDAPVSSEELPLPSDNASSPSN